jgi:ribose-phosphate pyrophosphokinase
MYPDAVIFALSSNKELTKEVSRLSGIKMGDNEIKHFADGEIIVENNTTVRGKNVYVIQSTSAPATERLFELLIFLDGLRRASAKSITVVMPYFGYARQDRKSKPREPITARLVADMIQQSGADHVMILDLHVTQIQGFFTGPVDDLSAIKLFAKHYRKHRDIDLNNTVIVSPDHGGAARARNLADELNIPEIAVIDKYRRTPNQVAKMNLIGNVEGKTAIIVDDIIDTANTLVEASKLLIKMGAKDVYVAASHGVLSGDASNKILNSPIKEVVITDSITLPKEKQNEKIKVVTIAPLLANAIKLIEDRGSLSTMYSVLDED